MWYIYKVEYCSATKPYKLLTHAIIYESQMHYSKRPDTKDYVWFHLHKILEKSKLEQEKADVGKKLEA